tara:strand:- start:11973 stop:12449 length:477 start_codon:yes stop_codon:yes gene_type:complete
MGIFDKLFKNNTKDEDNKHVLFATVGFGLAISDGEATVDEGSWIGNYISNIQGMTPERHQKIILRSQQERETIMQLLPSLDEDEKIELINFMVGVATADGYFHGEEAAYMYAFSMLMGLSEKQTEAIFDEVFSQFKIDVKEFESAIAKMKNNLNKAGF